MSNIREVQWKQLEYKGYLDILNKDATHNENITQKINTIVASQNIDGHWKDIDYNSRTQTAWIPAQHLLRLHQLAIAYTLPNNPLEANVSLFNAIVNGLQYWYDKDPRSTNWWNQQIFCPKQMGEILIMMRSGKKQIPMSLENAILQRMSKIGGEPDGRYSEGSANRINISSHWIYRGCLQHDLSILELGIENALLPIKFNSPGRGIQSDYSFQEHGPQLYIGNYGYAFIDNVANLCLFLKNTKYKLSGFQLDVFSQFVRNTYLNVIRGSYYSFSIPGRQVANKNDLDRSNTISLLEKMQLVDSTYSVVYQQAKERWLGNKPSNYYVPVLQHHFWHSDYSLHIRPNYFFDVRFVSTRTVRTENVNNENKKGFFLSDGATNMTIKGNEYFNIFPVWDWCKIPGVTSPHYDSLPDMPIGVGGDKGLTDFCGGVTDDSNGISCYQMNNERFHTSAKKSWFLLDQEIVCLGADIRSEDAHSVLTTINQNKSIGSYIASNKTENDLSGNEKMNANNSWIIQGGFGYFFPGFQQVNLSDANRIGDWRTISVSQKEEKVEDRIFALWIDHGIVPQKASYAYCIFPNITSSSQMKSILKNHTTTIIRNDAEAQILYEKNKNRWYVVLYKEGYIPIDQNKTIKISSPCLAMIEAQTEGYKVYVADPTQKCLSIHFSIEKNHKEVIKKIIPLPIGDSVGKTIKFFIK